MLLPPPLLSADAMTLPCPTSMLAIQCYGSRQLIVNQWLFVIVIAVVEVVTYYHFTIARHLLFTTCASQNGQEHFYIDILLSYKHWYRYQVGYHVCPRKQAFFLHPKKYCSNQI